MREDPQIVAAPDHWLATLIQALEKRLTSILGNTWVEDLGCSCPFGR
jgi:hypothetical protein